MASSMANPENENSVKKRKRSRDRDRDRDREQEQEQEQEQHKKTIFDWYEAGSCEIIAKHDIHRKFPLGWTERAFDAAHGFRRHHQGDADGNADDEPNDIHTRLWHVPDTPIQPSFIDFLTYCASVKLKQSELDIHKTSVSVAASVSVSDRSTNTNTSTSRGGHFDLQSYPNELEQDDNSLSDDDDDEVDDDDDSTYQELIMENKMRWKNTKIWAWKEESSVSVSVSVSEQEQSKNMKILLEEYKTLYHKFDETAAVALATFAEESLVSSLLPMARKHVSKCREEYTSSGASPSANPSGSGKNESASASESGAFQTNSGETGTCMSMMNSSLIIPLAEALHGLYAEGTTHTMTKRESVDHNFLPSMGLPSTAVKSCAHKNKKSKVHARVVPSLSEIMNQPSAQKKKKGRGSRVPMPHGLGVFSYGADNKTDSDEDVHIPYPKVIRIKKN